MISILTSTYNNEPYIGEYLDSVIAQTYTDWELILIDDGSTDRTKEIVESYNDKRIHYYYKPHTNLPDSLNIGLDYCKGDYIARADADDKMFPNRLQIQFDFMESHPDVDMMGNAMIAYKLKDGEWKKVILLHNKTWYIPPEEFFRGTPIWHGNWIMRGTTWRRDRIYYNTEYWCGQDCDYLLNCVTHGWKMYNDGENVTMFRRIHNRCITVNYREERMKFYREIRKKYKKI